MIRKRTIRTICLLCGKGHRTALPKKCAVQGAVMSALFRALPPEQRFFASLICDKTPFLSDAWKRIQKIK